MNTEISFDEVEGFDLFGEATGAKKQEVQEIAPEVVWIHGKDWVEDELYMRDVRAAHRYITRRKGTATRKGDPLYLSKAVNAGPGLQVRPYQGDGPVATLVIGAGRKVDMLVNKMDEMQFWTARNVRFVIGAIVWESRNRVRIEGAIDMTFNGMCMEEIKERKIRIWRRSAIDTGAGNELFRAVVWLRWDTETEARYNQVISSDFVGRTLILSAQPRTHECGVPYITFELEPTKSDMMAVRQVAAAVWRKANRAARLYDIYKGREPRYDDPICRRHSKSLPRFREALAAGKWHILAQRFPFGTPMVKSNPPVWTKSCGKAPRRFYQEALRDLIVLDTALMTAELRTRVDKALTIAKQTAPTTEEAEELLNATAEDLE